MPGWGVGQTLPLKAAPVASEMPQQIPSSSPDRYRIPLRIAGKAARAVFPVVPEISSIAFAKLVRAPCFEWP